MCINLNVWKIWQSKTFNTVVDTKYHPSYICPSPAFRIPYRGGILVCDPIPRRILEIEIPGVDSCSRSAKWALDRPGDGCHTPILGSRSMCLHTSLVRTNIGSLLQPPDAEIIDFFSCFSRRPDDPMPILLSANRNPHLGFQFQEFLVRDHKSRSPVRIRNAPAKIEAKIRPNYETNTLSRNWTSEWLGILIFRVATILNCVLSFPRSARRLITCTIACIMGVCM